MIKKLAVIMSAAAIALSLSACNNKTDEEYRKISGKEYACDFSFEVPSNWENTSENGILSATVLNDVSKANITGFSFSHGLESEPSAIDYWNEYYEKQLSDTFKNVEVKSDNEAQIGTRTVAKAEYIVTIGEEKFNCDIMLAVFNGRVYTFTLTQGIETEENKQNYTDYTQVFEQSLKTFKIG